MRELINTPIKIDHLNDQYASFVGTAVDTRTVSSLMGSQEVEQNYPAVYLQRGVWEGLGSPTLLTLVLVNEKSDAT
jgi:hypothetical protein